MLQDGKNLNGAAYLRLRLSFFSALCVSALLICLGLFAAQTVYALDPAKPLTQCRLDVWGARDGLPPYEISSIAQTPDGYVWLGTDAGLVRFDGDGFVVYNRANTPSLTTNMITALLAGHDGTLWVGTEWGGYGRFAEEKFLPFGTKYTSWNLTDSLMESKDGSLWVSEWTGLGHFQVDHGTITGRQIKANSVVFAAAELAPNKALCITMSQPPLVIDVSGKTLTYVTQPAFTNNDYTCLRRARDGSFWIGTAHHGLYRIQNHRLRHYTQHDGLSSNAVNCLYQDKQGTLWVGTTVGIDSFRDGRILGFGTAEGLVNSNVRAICEDREGNLWVGAGYGLHRFANTRLTPYLLQMNREPAVITSMKQTPAGQLLCATDQGIWALNAHRGADIRVQRWLTDHEILAVGRYADGSLFGRYAVPKGEAFFSLQGKHLDTWKDTVSPDKFFPLGNELIAFDQTHYFRFQKKRRKMALPHIDEMIYCEGRDRKGALWIGSTNGLQKLKDGKFIFHNKGLTTETHILSIDTSDPQQLWLGTDRGIGKFDGTKITLYGLKEGLPDDNIFNLVRDHHGVLWAGGHFGIFSVRPQDLEAYDQARIKTIPAESYNASDGIRTYPTLLGDSECMPDGRLWFGGPHGLTMIDPDFPLHNTLAPPVHIENAGLDGMALDLTRKTQVQAGPGKLNIQYAALSFTAPEKVQFKYRLLGFDDVWVNAGSSRTAAYTNLPPGTYRFQVIACNNDGVWNRSGDAIDFVLKPHYYQMLWFRVLTGLGLLLLVAGLTAWRLAAMRAQNRRLKVGIAERTEQLAEAQEELIAQNSQLQNNQAELEAQYEEIQQVKEDLKIKNIVLEAANTRLADLATIDGLTGLKNHRAFQEHLEEEWAKAVRYQTPLSVLLLDIDQFKLYNDTYGHPAGDNVLRQIGQTLQDCARDTDFVARYGGEEFVVILPHTDLSGACVLAERYRQAIETASWPRRAVTGSFGIATRQLTTSGPSQLITEADSALYRSKEAGRNRVSTFSDFVPT